MKVLITTAGVGSRIGSDLNKGMLSVGGKPVLSHIIEKFDESVEIVLSLGYGADVIKQYVQLVYPDRRFTFVEISPFEGEGASPAHSILSCEEYLQCPFIFITNDTIVEGPIPEPTNWIGASEHEDKYEEYRTLDVEKSQLNEKGQHGYAYIGLAGIKDYEVFWRGMKEGDPQIGESNGLRRLIAEKEVTVLRMIWHDTGNHQSLKDTQQTFQINGLNIIDKHNEAIYFTDNKVIKYSSSPSFIKKRVERARQFKDFLPEIKGASSNFFWYDHIPGKTLSSIVNLKLFKQFLNYMDDFWAIPSNEYVDVGKFYLDKMEKRLDAYEERFEVGYPCTINGVEVPSTYELVKRVKASHFWTSSIYSVIHGDLTLENVIMGDDGQFHLIDWRQGFGDSLNTLDRLYDFAKLNQSCLISYSDILKDKYSLTRNGDSVELDFCSPLNLMVCRDFLKEIVDSETWNAISIITGLIFLSNAPLQISDKYAQFSYYLGRFLLEELV